MICRSGPSYSPQARAWSNGGGWAMQRAHRPVVMIRHDFRGSPQESHHGGLTVRMEFQHRRQTGPRRPVPSARPQAAHAGWQPGLEALDRSAAEIREALRRDPGSRLLLQRLRDTYTRRLALSRRALYA